MSPRQVRRAVVLAVALLALVDVGLAATPHHSRGMDVARALSASRAFSGPRYLLLVAGVVLLALLPGLRAAKRNAWRLALALSVASALGHHLSGLDVIGLLAAGTTVGILLATHASFPVPPIRPTPPRAGGSSSSERPPSSFTAWLGCGC